jgi:DNA modification methylase
VLDPFAGIGTVGEAASSLKRRFVLFENNSEYVEIIRQNIEKWLRKQVSEVNWINCEPVETKKLYLSL